MSATSRLNLIGFGVLFAVSAGLSIYALARQRSGVVRPPEPAATVPVEAVERSAAVPRQRLEQPRQEMIVPSPDPVPTPAAVRPRDPAPASTVPQVQADPEAGAVAAALDGMAGWASRGFSHADPRFTQVAEVVRGHLPAAVSHWRASRGESYADEAMMRAILLAIRAEDRDQVLEALLEAPWLAASLEPHGWAADAHEILRRQLADEDQRLPEPAIDWAMAFASAAGPADHALLARVLMRISSDIDQQRLVERMRSMPGCDWQAAVLQAWDGRSVNGSQDAHARLALLAAQVGSRDAFIEIGGLAIGERRLREQARAWLEVQPAVVGVQPSPDWFAQVRDRLEFRVGAWHLGAAVPQPVAQRPRPRLPSPQPDPPILPLPSGLAPGADAAAVRTWIDGLAPAMEGRRRMGRGDPVALALAAVPSEHLAELLSAEERHERNFAMQVVLEEAILRSVRQQHRELVLRRLARQSFLVETLLPRGWAEEAAPTLRRMLVPGVTRNMSDSTKMVEILALIGDPADHVLLRETLVRMRYGYWQAKMAEPLETMPGFDADAAVRAAWGKFARSDYGDGQDAFAVVAARHGVQAAMPVVIAHATGGEVKHKSDTLAKEARAFLAQAFAIEPEPEVITAWWATAQPSVRWDESAHRWIGPSAASPRAAPSGGNF